MFHLDERLLEKLVSGSAPVSDVERIRHHVRECRSCSQRLEEWRDAYAEVDYSYPELAHRDSATTLTAGGMVVVPEEEGRHWALPRLNFANALWLVALLMALVVGYGANRLRRAPRHADTRRSRSHTADSQGCRPRRRTAGPGLTSGSAATQADRPCRPGPGPPDPRIERDSPGAAPAGSRVAQFPQRGAG
jgi:hypothetical protein